MLSGLQSARKEARSTDAAVLEAQLHQMLGECRAEHTIPSPASSLQMLGECRAEPNVYSPASSLQITLGDCTAYEQDHSLVA